MADAESTRNRLYFAEKRLNELKKLNNGKIGAASGKERQQLIQEFFFHLVGSIDFLLQVVNQSRKLCIPEEDVKEPIVCERLMPTDPIKPLLKQIHPRTKDRSIEGDPYSEDNSYFRILILRHKVCHQGDNPFHLRFGGPLPCASLFIDPREIKDKGSNKHVFEELDNFISLVNNKVEQILKILGV